MLLKGARKRDNNIVNQEENYKVMHLTLQYSTIFKFYWNIKWEYSELSKYHASMLILWHTLLGLKYVIIILTQERLYCKWQNQC